MPTQAPAPARTETPKQERRFSFEMIRRPVGEPYLQLTMQTSMSARPDPTAFFVAPQTATVVAKDVTLAQALRMVGEATNTHFEERDGVQVLLPGPPKPAAPVEARRFTPGPEADPILRTRSTNYYGFSRHTCIDVLVRLLNTNVVVDPAAMSTGDCNLGISFDRPSFDDLLAQLGLRAELRGEVVHMLPLAGTGP
jgi:hypothetical protein